MPLEKLEKRLLPSPYEFLLDRVAEALIESPIINSLDVENSQKFIRNGHLKTGQGEGVLALFQKDIKANEEDLNTSIEVQGDENTSVQQSLQEIADNINFSLTSIVVTEGANNSVSISLSGGEAPYNGLNITNLVFDGSVNNQLNVSQFIPITKQQSVVNVRKAEEFLDTNIFELLPSGDTRQSRITRFFQELNALLPPQTPEFETPVQRNQAGDWIGSEQYSLDNSIDEEEAFIHRLSDTANDTNKLRTIEEIYNRVVPYLTDILEDPIIPQDDREEYRNQSSGYLKFRNLNQGIIIRNTNQDFLEGLNPDTRNYLQTGFTITMWVRFLDKVSNGTLFNFGNPLRGDGDDTAFGFRLETYVINGDENPVKSSYGGQTEGEYLSGFGSSGQTWKEIFQDGSFEGNLFQDGNRQVPNEGFFNTSNTERFVRLVVNEEPRIRGSHMGMPFMARRRGLPEFGMFDYFTDTNTPPYDHAYGLMTNTRIPTDFTEWYFICATFNPNIDETESHNNTGIYQSYKNNSNFWRNNVSLNGGDIVDSGLGAKCKVEIISRSDLLRARGFKV